MIPLWPEGTAAVLCVAGPHAIPVSTAVVVGERRILLAIARRRETLVRIRADPACALCVVAAELAITVTGEAAVLREELEAASRVAAIELIADDVQDHLADGRTEIVAGIEWRWRWREDERKDAAVRAELAELGRMS
ncbi:MAG: hypothetical protein NVSMB25_15580 [Thermoleophilaceae bacterium]